MTAPTMTAREAAVAPAAPVVVEVTGEEFWTAQWPKGSPWAALSEETRLAVSAAAARLNDTIRARAATDKDSLQVADTVPCRIVRRPTETVTALVVPEDGYWMFRWQMQLFPGYTAPHIYKAGHYVSGTYDAIRRIDTDAPTTWIERTTTPQAREWRAEDVPEGRVCIYCANGLTMSYPANSSRESVADQANLSNAPALLILPAEVSHG